MMTTLMHFGLKLFVSEFVRREDTESPLGVFSSEEDTPPAKKTFVRVRLRVVYYILSRNADTEKEVIYRRPLSSCEIILTTVSIIGSVG